MDGGEARRAEPSRLCWHLSTTLNDIHVKTSAVQCTLSFIITCDVTFKTF